MTNLESRLREVLADVETRPVDPSALARAARRSAARTRRRVVVGTASAVAAALIVVVVGAIDLGREQALVPATPTPVQGTVTAGELCSRTAKDITAEALGPGPLSESYSALALCPADPSAGPGPADDALSTYWPLTVNRNVLPPPGLLSTQIDPL